MEGAGLANRAVVFVKPHANCEAARSLVEARLAESGVRIVARGTVEGSQIEESGTIGKSPPEEF